MNDYIERVSPLLEHGHKKSNMVSIFFRLIIICLISIVISTVIYASYLLVILELVTAQIHMNSKHKKDIED